METKTDKQRVDELWDMLEKLGKLHDDFAHMTVHYVLDRNWDKAAETAAECERTLNSIRSVVSLLARAPQV